MFTPSKYQLAVFNEIENGNSDLVVEATAGSGKSTTLVEVTKRISTRGLLLAFNKHIVQAIQPKVARNITVKTIHSIGYGCIREFIRGLQSPNDNKYREISKTYANLVIQEANNFRLEPFKIAKEINNVSRFARLTLTNPNNPDDLKRMIGQFGLEVTEQELILPVIGQVIADGDLLAKTRGEIDFTDMLWLPHSFKLNPSAYPVVLVDECLPYKTPILLANGVSMQIGDIVEQKLSVDVLAYDTVTKEQRPCRVTGWSKTLNQKPLVKIKVRYRKEYPSGNQTVTNFVVCTTDHKVWADNQWLFAGDVKVGMTMQVETSAEKSQAYKITTSGRSVVSATMTAKNLILHSNNCSNKGGQIKQRGGNGQGLTVPQQIMLDALGSNWIAEYAIPTKVLRGNGYPPNYKVDIANLQFKIAVELDGQSHRCQIRKKQDNKKDSFLSGLGWRVIRIPNKEAVQDTNKWASELNSLAKCVGGDCPVDVKVVSVETVTIPDYYVYDITVEDCHNFYANGILVHNCQDLNSAQLELVIKCCNGRGRKVFVGDRFQAIMAFCGANSDSMDRIIERTNAKTLPLSICYRCPTSHIELAKEFSPNIEPAPGAIEGEVKYISEFELANAVNVGDLVLCRMTAPLIRICLELIAKQIPAQVKGEDVGKQLIDVINDVAKMPGFDYRQFDTFLETYSKDKAMKLAVGEDSHLILTAFLDKIDGVRYCYEWFKSRTVDWLCQDIDRLFSDRNSEECVILSTIHRAKGLENDTVFILYPEKLPLTWKKQKPHELEQEYNIAFVAHTRAKKTLVMVRQSEKPSFSVSRFEIGESDDDF